MKYGGLLRRLIKENKIPGATPRPFCSAIVAAAGSSTRMGFNKLFALLGGKPVLAHTLLALEGCDAVDEIVVAARQEDISRVALILTAYGIHKPVRVVPGGRERTDSVRAALAQCSREAGLIAVHDGARPLATPELIGRSIHAGWRRGAALAAVPVKDTIKRSSAKKGSALPYVVSTPDRRELYQAQTPQVFDADLLRAAYAKAERDNIKYTDDCAPVEALGKHVFICEGDYTNIKITTPEDLILAEAILEARNAKL